MSTATFCSLHHPRIKDKSMRVVTRISVPWWWKWKNELLGEAARKKAIKRSCRFYCTSRLV